MCAEVRKHPQSIYKEHKRPLYSTTRCTVYTTALAKAATQQGKPVQAQPSSKGRLLHEKRMSMSRQAVDSLLLGDVETIEQPSTKTLTSYYKIKQNEKKIILQKENFIISKCGCI